MDLHLKSFGSYHLKNMEWTRELEEWLDEPEGVLDYLQIYISRLLFTILIVTKILATSSSKIESDEP